LHPDWIRTASVAFIDGLGCSNAGRQPADRHRARARRLDPNDLLRNYT
jgi:hypothetical protein